MRAVSISKLKAHLSRYLREVRNGGEVQILDRGVPVARLVGLHEAEVGDVERRDRLIRAGILRPATVEAASSRQRQPLELPRGFTEALQRDRADRIDL